MILKNENVKKLETQWYDRKRTIDNKNSFIYLDNLQEFLLLFP